MTGFGTGSRDESSAQIVRTVGRLASILVELRDEYVSRPRDGTMDQIEQRLDELIDLRESLRAAREQESQTTQ